MFASEIPPAGQQTVQPPTPPASDPKTSSDTEDKENPDTPNEPTPTARNFGAFKRKALEVVDPADANAAKRR